MPTSHLPTSRTHSHRHRRLMCSGPSSLSRIIQPAATTAKPIVCGPRVKLPVYELGILVNVEDNALLQVGLWPLYGL